ncbi:YabP/YqfC family sporulation protein [Alicyclobacillus acidocaldarius]|uniref:YabP family protein n=1 Tax=Alicyclobacillus acidocaldarius (strain Tc-4-1) TaxID=1048834 RepID=F8IJN8_ALIAT|nr:YabP/YqfC family sporulation protein [Alicyclobacillus acidocaldarius]AEJ42227.1 YabP family protein [Alicyclobacillus acidocaldarius subsp. acidocaldarius Tc-4-1]
MDPAEGHDVHIFGRREIEVTGVERLERFDAEAFVIATRAGELSVQGKSLAIKAFDRQTGIIRIEGEIGALLYGDHRRAPRWGRLRP